MAIKSGSASSAIYKIATTWGTAVAGGAGNKISAEISPNYNVEELLRKEIGSGSDMVKQGTRGNFIPTASLKMDGGYRNCMDNIIAQMMGTAGAPTEQTASQGDYKHTITYNSSLNAKYGTLAWEDSSTTTLEFSTCATTSLMFDVEAAPGILSFGCEQLANTATLTSATNTNATLAAATATDTEVIAYDQSDTFRINLNSGGTLAGGDQFNIVNYSLKLNRPQKITGQIRGASGNSAPISDGLGLDGTLDLTVESLADHTYFTYWSAETTLKCTLNIQGTQIGSGVNKAITIYIPKMVQIKEPVYNLTSPGINSLALSFKLVQATANPTGMSSTLPYFEIINGLSTSLLA